MTSKDSNRPPSSEIGRRIQSLRKREGLTQDQYGRQYDVSGPAIFKFEKGKVNPSHSLWMKIAKDLGMSEQHASLLWIREKVPAQYSHYIDIQLLLAERSQGKEAPNYSAIKDVTQLKRAVKKDPNLPQALRELLEEDDIWKLFKPTGVEIEEVFNRFASIGFGSKEDYREALRLVRSFLKGKS